MTNQVSKPMLIALVATLAFAVVWFFAMRPKPPGEDPTPASTPAAPAAQASPVPAPATPATPAAAPVAPVPAPAPAATAKVAAGDPSARLVEALDDRKAVVLLFWNRAGADDRAARRAVSALPRRGGKVVTAVASIGDVARYEAITTGVQVLTAPTVLVISPERRAKAITGFTDVKEIDQAVGDALRRPTAAR